VDQPIGSAPGGKPTARLARKKARLFAHTEHFDFILLQIFDEWMRKINESAASCLDSGKNG
jgi:hypothetical protein